MYLSCFPTLSRNAVRSGKTSRGTFLPPLNAPATFYYYRGANAVFNAVASLPMKPEDHILMPAYHCGVEVEAVLTTGIQVRFYNIKETLEADLADIRQRIDKNTRAVFVIHYFGFFQPIADLKRICEEYHLLLIEDCAHALYSRCGETLLGSDGDVSIFSFQKTLPVPDGGALVINNKNFTTSQERQKPSAMTTLRGVTLLRLEHVHMFHPGVYAAMVQVCVKPARALFRLMKKSRCNSCAVTAANTRDFKREHSSLGISDVSLKIVQDADADGIADKRREHFQFLAGALKDLSSAKMIYHDLPEGVCPLFFPLLHPERDDLQIRLARRGVNTFIFGKTLHASLPKGQFPTAELFSRQNICLPIHQDMNKNKLAYLVQTLASELGEASRSR